MPKRENEIQKKSGKDALSIQAHRRRLETTGEFEPVCWRLKLGEEVCTGACCGAGAW